jgi:hypothetical protein
MKEFHIAVIPVSATDSVSGVGARTAEKYLNDMANQGWEVVHVNTLAPTKEGVTFTFLFSRDVAVAAQAKK